MTAYYETFPTPAGPFSLAVNEANAVVATAFGGLERLSERCTCSKFETNPTRTAEARRQVEAYFSGKLEIFTLPLAPSGTAFQQSVWSALAQIPFGETRSYGQLAKELESGPRAVGGANGANPIALIVPCHRVIGSNGKLTGFAFGNAIKQLLLEHEGIMKPVQSAELFPAYSSSQR